MAGAILERDPKSPHRVFCDVREAASSCDGGRRWPGEQPTPERPRGERSSSHLGCSFNPPRHAWGGSPWRRHHDQHSQQTEEQQAAAAKAAAAATAGQCGSSRPDQRAAQCRECACKAPQAPSRGARGSKKWKGHSLGFTFRCSSGARNRGATGRSIQETNRIKSILLRRSGDVRGVRLNRQF